MARTLIEHGHTVTLVCGSNTTGTTGLGGPFSVGKRRGVVDGIDVIELDLAYSNNDGFVKRAWTFLMFALRSIWIALTEKYDLVFATSTPLTTSIPGIFARWIRGKPFVFEVRDLWPELPREMGVITNPVALWAMGLLEWVSYHSAHRLVGLSPGIVEGIKKRGVSGIHIAMVPNGCDLDIFTESATPWRPQGVAGSDLMAVFAGTHGIANGLDAVLDAAGELKKRGRDDIKLVLIGSGKLKATLQARAKRENLSNVVFHAPVKKSELAGLMRATDIGMQILANVPAFYYGTSPNKFFDYIAAGLPVLNNYPGWLAEMIENEQCGYAVPPADPVVFADVLEQAASERDQLPIMGQKAKALAKRDFDRERMADEWLHWVTGAAR